MDLDNNAHSVFLLHYHLVLVVKYRRQVFDDAEGLRNMKDLGVQLAWLLKAIHN